jgi:hypothetical protein
MSRKPDRSCFMGLMNEVYSCSTSSFHPYATFAPRPCGSNMWCHRIQYDKTFVSRVLLLSTESSKILQNRDKKW